MKLGEMIELLQRLEESHGSDMEVRVSAGYPLTSVYTIEDVDIQTVGGPGKEDIRVIVIDGGD